MTDKTTDPAALAEAALNMELPECDRCEGKGYFHCPTPMDDHQYEDCDCCSSTGKDGGLRAVTGLAGLKEALKFHVKHLRPGMGGFYLYDATQEVAAIVGYIAKMCGEESHDH